MGPGPAGEGVGREPGVHHGESGHEGVFAQVGIEGAELLRVQHPLVDDGAAGKAGEVEVPPAWKDRTGNLLLSQATDHIELPLEAIPGWGLGPAPNEDLTDDGLAGPGGDAQVGIVRGDIPPAEDPLALAFGDLLEDLLAGVAVAIIRGQEEHPDAVLAGRRQLQPRGPAAGGQKGMGDLGEDARAIPRGFLAARGPAMLQVAEHLQGLADDVMGRSALGVHHETEAAGIMLLGGIV